MPIYEYECSRCGARTERLIRRPEDVPQRCPRCGATALKKLLSAFRVAGGSEEDVEEASNACSSCEDDACPYNDGDEE